MWFLFALPVYFVIAKALRRWPRATLAGAATLAGSLSWFGIEEVNRAQVLFCFLFFAIGAYRPRLVSDAVARLPVPAALGAFVLALTIVNADVVPRSIPVLVAGVAGVALGLAVARHLARSVLADAFAWLGRRTMRVYVLHLVVLSAVMYLPSPLTRGPLAGSLPFALVYPLVLTGVRRGRRVSASTSCSPGSRRGCSPPRPGWWRRRRWWCRAAPARPGWSTARPDRADGR